MTFELQTFPNGITISQPPTHTRTKSWANKFLLSYLTAKLSANKPICWKGGGG